MRLRRLIAAALVAAVLFPNSVSAGSASKGARLGLVLHDGVSLRSGPSTHASVVAVLVEQTQVELLKTTQQWRHVRIWASVKGWLPAREVVFRKPWKTVSTYRAPEVHYHVQVHGALALDQAAVLTSPTPLFSGPGGHRLSVLPAGSVAVTAWRQDATGSIWYGMRGGWVRADSVVFAGPDPTRTTVGGLLLWQGAAGKGMWITLGPIADSNPKAIVQAALDSGIRHLYLESAISPLGFHGKQSVGPLLEEAHRHGLIVLAWVYPYLYDIASDVALTREVAAYRSKTGEQFDGIAADLERNMAGPAISAYSQLIRAYLGQHYLLVGVTYPAQSLASYPFGAVARSYNVVAPMDYWHQTATSRGLNYGGMGYGADYSQRYAEDSILAIRRAAPGAKIEPIGQAFDNFGHEEMGPNAPSAEEIKGFLRGSKLSGAIGVSFFQWMTATDAEWRAIRAFRY
jgi:hypothetical protein